MKRPLVIFSTQGWTDLWVSKHWIANEFSKDREVLFVEPAARLTPRALVKGRLLNGDLKKVRPNLYSLSTVTFPFPFRVPSIFRPIWRAPLAVQFEKAMSVLGFDEFDVLNFSPHSLSLIKSYKDRVHRNIYYAVDPPLGREDFFWSESRCVRESDYVFAVTPMLRDLIVSESGRSDVEVLPHGVDYSGVSCINEDVSASLGPVLDEISKTDVVVGYTGAIHDVCIDQEVVLNAVKKRPHWNFVFVGPYKGSTLSNKKFDVSVFESFHNVKFLGAVPYKKLKYLICKFDVCIVPYNRKVNVNWERRSPFKVLGYLAQGKPVVISNVPAANNYAGYVYTYESKDEFLEACEDALNSDYKESVARKDFASNHDFSILFKKISSRFD